MKENINLCLWMIGYISTPVFYCEDEWLHPRYQLTASFLRPREASVSVKRPLVILFIVQTKIFNIVTVFLIEDKWWKKGVNDGLSQIGS